MSGEWLSKHRPEWRGITRPAQAFARKAGDTRGPRFSRPVFDRHGARPQMLGDLAGLPATMFSMAKSELLRSHDELRAALRLAGTEIRKLNFGRSDTPVLQLLRRVLQDARAVSKAEKSISLQ